jgi:hypothetical protein
LSDQQVFLDFSHRIARQTVYTNKLAWHLKEANFLQQRCSRSGKDHIGPLEIRRARDPHPDYGRFGDLLLFLQEFLDFPEPREKVKSLWRCKAYSNRRTREWQDRRFGSPILEAAVRKCGCRGIPTPPIAGEDIRLFT